MCNLSQSIENKGIEKGAYQASYASAKKLVLSGVPIDVIKTAMPHLSDKDFVAIQQEVAGE